MCGRTVKLNRRGSTSGTANYVSVCQGFKSQATLKKIYNAFPTEMNEIFRNFLPDSKGYVGRNKTYDQMLSPRFQEGVGSAAKFFLAIDNLSSAEDYFRGVRAGTEGIDGTTGQVYSYLPPDSHSTLGPSDYASAASFYLGDACSAAAALHDTTAVSKLRLAAQWLLQQENARGILAASDRAYTNRLLFDARAFIACGNLLSDSALILKGESFLELAKKNVQDDGVLLEGGGHDTSYQSVSVRNLFDIISESTGYCEIWLPIATKATLWLHNRVRDDGTVDSSGNTRTCSGGEQIDGQPKLLSITKVFESLAFFGTLFEDGGFVDSAKLVSGWYSANASVSPCQ